MIRKLIIPLGALTLVVLLAACAEGLETPIPSTMLDISNPASDYCVEQGYTLEIITAEDGSQSGICIFDDGSSCDEWAYFRGECGPSSPDGTSDDAADALSSPESTPAEDASSPTVSPADYQGWWTYTHPSYAFSLLLPEDWVVDQETSADSLLSGHLITLHPKTGVSGENIRVTFRQVGDDTLLWPTGVGQGEFVPQGTLEIAGEPALRYLLVCPSGETTAIWYHQAEGVPAVTRGNLEFGFIFHAGSHCAPGLTLEGKNQLIGEMILSSLSLQ